MQINLNAFYKCDLSNQILKFFYFIKKKCFFL